ncbi:MAG: hypothetical protein DMG51_12285 [Acidobacteria bacterium]|nr:MAG: hypothetical protein DMG51_12285 [Acidobacteriota bacterium]
MNYAVLLQSALVALLRNKMRSVLTVLGITIGIAAVICVVAIGKAGQAQVEQQLNNLGDNFVWIEAGGRAVNGVRTGTHGTKTLTFADAVAIKNQISLIKSVSPNVDGPVQIIYGNQNWFTGFRGVTPEYFDIKRCVSRTCLVRSWPPYIRRGCPFPGRIRTIPFLCLTRRLRRRSKGLLGWTTSCARRYRKPPSKWLAKRRQLCSAIAIICAQKRKMTSIFETLKTLFRRNSRPAGLLPFF